MPTNETRCDNTPRPTHVVAIIPRTPTTELRITLGGVGKIPLATIREWYLAEDDFRPGRSGIALALHEVMAVTNALKKLAETLDLDVEEP